MGPEARCTTSGLHESEVGTAFHHQSIWNEKGTNLLLLDLTDTLIMIIISTLTRWFNHLE